MAQPTEGACPNCAKLQDQVDKLAAGFEELMRLIQLYLRAAIEGDDKAALELHLTALLSSTNLK